MNTKKYMLILLGVIMMGLAFTGCTSDTSVGDNPDLSGTWYHYNPPYEDNGYNGGVVYKITFEKVSDHVYKMTESKFYMRNVYAKHQLVNEKEYGTDHARITTLDIAKGPNKNGVLPIYDDAYEWVPYYDEIKEETLLTVRDGKAYDGAFGATHTIKKENGKLMLVSDKDSNSIMYKTDDSFFTVANEQEAANIKKKVDVDNAKHPNEAYQIRNIAFTVKESDKKVYAHSN